MQQAEALSIMKMGYNVYLTGSAGSGKTYTINQFIGWAREHLVSVAVTASTGIAATHISGQTIHSWSGIGIKTELKPSDITKLKGRKDIVRRLQKAKVLIIDEISMIDANLLDNLNLICKKLRSDEAAFGGLQVILTGDLFQLPPVNKSGSSVKLAVESEAWRELKPVICYLGGQHRQKDADPLSLILDSIRTATTNEEHLEILKTRIVDPADQNFKTATRLHSHNQEVDSFNDHNLSLVAGEEKTFTALKTGPLGLVEALTKSCLAPEVLKLKVGAEVMFVKNNQAGKFVNGTRGQVVNFNSSGWPVVRTLSGKIVVAEPESWQIEDDTNQPLASIAQVPLRLAWAITVHKSQGMSLDQAVIDLSAVFEYGMGYVALSRVRSLEGLILSGLHLDALNINPKVLKYDIKLKAASAEASDRLGKLGQKKIAARTKESILNKGGMLDSTAAKEVITKLKASGKRSLKVPSYLITKNLLLEGLSLEDAANERGVKLSTIINHLIQITKEDETAKLKFKRLKPRSAQLRDVKKAKKLDGGDKLGPIKYQLEKMGLNLSFDEIRLSLVWT